MFPPFDPSEITPNFFHPIPPGKKSRKPLVCDSTIHAGVTVFDRPVSTDGEGKAKTAQPRASRRLKNTPVPTYSAHTAAMSKGSITLPR